MAHLKNKVFDLCNESAAALVHSGWLVGWLKGCTLPLM